MDFNAVADRVINAAKPKAPKCSICEGEMQVAGNADGKTVWACSRVKSLNMQGDTRPYDPDHYLKSKVTKTEVINFATLKTGIVEALERVAKDAWEEFSGDKPQGDQEKKGKPKAGKPKAEKPKAAPKAEAPKAAASKPETPKPEAPKKQLLTDDKKK